MPVSPFDITQGKPASGASPANISAQKAPLSAGSGGRPFIKIPTEALFSGIGQILFLASIVVVIGISVIFLGIPSLQKGISTGSQSHKVGPLIPPINVADIKFPSKHEQDRFLKSFQGASKTTDYLTRNKLLGEAYLQLYGFYTVDHDSKTRKVLEQYAQYMINNYPDQAQKNIYTVPCFDTQCGKANYPAAILAIKDKISASSAVDKDVKDRIMKDLETAAVNSDKNIQWQSYYEAFEALLVEAKKTGDSGLAEDFSNFKEFLKTNFPDNFAVLEKALPGQVKI